MNCPHCTPGIDNCTHEVCREHYGKKKSLDRWVRIGPHGGPPEVYARLEQPDYLNPGTMLVNAVIEGVPTKIIVKKKFYRREDAVPPLDPKGAAGKAKPQLQLIPPVFNEALAGALAAGAEKYGPWNWRGARVELMTYIGAIRRHTDAVLSGEEIDPDSGVSHLGHIAASCAILLDAAAAGMLEDNRPITTPSTEV